MTVLSEVLLEEGYHSTDELARDWALMVALARLEQYQAECEFFKKSITYHGSSLIVWFTEKRATRISNKKKILRIGNSPPMR